MKTTGEVLLAAVALAQSAVQFQKTIPGPVPLRSAQNKWC